MRDLVEKCTCPSQFPMIRVSEGKYRIGDTKVLIFVRVSINFYYPNTVIWGFDHVIYTRACITT